MTEAARYARLSDLFAGALALPVPERAAFVDRECGADQALRHDLAALLSQADSDAAALLSQGPIVAVPVPESPLPERLGPYRILRRIGAGGMGVVYEAEQDQPRRLVALKVVRAGVQQPQLRRRFAVEAEALGRLQHRGIAQIYAAGTADTGAGPQPYFAMERIHGLPLDEWARAQQPRVDQAVRILIEICDAVQHAHQNGVIHRDLKPANILVDRSGQPKVLDFGVARAVDSDLAVATLDTDVGQMVGTLAYMSPEQVEADPAAIDTRTDVYSLGVVAFEVLSGRLPLEIRGSGLLEAARLIRDVEAPRLSSVVPRIDADLDTIVAKALEKDRSRRYPSAAALGEDLRRFLEHRPINAKPATAAYQLRRFARRNRGLVWSASAVLFLLIAGTIGSASGWMRAVERGRLAEARGQDALREADKVTRIHTFLLEDLLSSPDPRRDGRDVRVVDWLARASARVAPAFVGVPDIESEVRITLGRTYRNLSEFGPAEEHLRRAHELSMQEFGADSERTLQAANLLTQVMWDTGRHAEAETLIRDAFARAERLLGPDHALALEAANFLGLLLWENGDAAAAEALFRRVRDVRMRQFGGDHRLTLVAAKNLVLALRDLDRNEEAEEVATDTLERRRRLFGEDDPDTLHSLMLLGMMKMDAERYAEAYEIYQRVVAGRRRVLGPAHNDTLDALNSFGSVCLDIGRFKEAEQIYDEILAAAREVEGLSPRDLVLYLNGAASAYERGNRFEDAERLHRESIDLRRQIYGDVSLETARALNNLGVFLSNRARYTDGLPFLEEALAVRRKLYGDDHHDVANSLANIAAVRGFSDDHLGAIAYAREALVTFRALKPDGSIEIVHAQIVLGRNLLMTGAVDEACALFENSADLVISLLGADNARARQFVEMAASSLAKVGLAGPREKLLARLPP